jgi:vacuolar-type H+-ATPase subunit H
MSEPNEQARRLAMLLQAIEQEERNFAEARTEHKDCMERLHNQAYALRQEILSGQKPLPLETVQS